MNEEELKAKAGEAHEQDKILDLERELQAAKSLLAESKAKEKLLNSKILEWEARFDAVQAIEAHQKKISIRPRKSVGKSETTAFLLCSDWHVEEPVLPESVRGLNEFNMKIADDRINRLFDRSLRLVEIMRHRTRIDDMVLILGGDFFTGHIHEEGLESNTMGPIEAALWVKPRIQAGIDFLLEKGGFRSIKIPCCVGNHSRITQKIRIKTEYQNSIEWFLYCVMADHYRDDKRVQFKLPTGYFNTFHVYGHLIRAHHGTAIRYGGGVGGLEVPLKRYIYQKNQGQPAFMDCMGHHHNYIPHQNYVCNGSLIGYSDFPNFRGFPFEPAQQAMWFIEKDLGITAHTPIILQ